MNPRLAQRPAERGLPIPFAAETPEGTADFAVVQGTRSLECAVKKLCGVCGQKLDYWIAFIGGPLAAAAETYIDPPMHPECAEDSVTLCPYIARRAPKRSRKVEERTVTPSGFVDDKPEQWVIYVTRSFQVFKDSTDSLVYQAGKAHHLRWFSYDDNGQIKFDQEVKP